MHRPIHILSEKTHKTEESDDVEISGEGETLCTEERNEQHQDLIEDDSEFFLFANSLFLCIIL